MLCGGMGAACVHTLHGREDLRLCRSVCESVWFSECTQSSKIVLKVNE